MPGIITQKDSHIGALHGLSEYILNLKHAFLEAQFSQDGPWGGRASLDLRLGRHHNGVCS